MTVNATIPVAVVDDQTLFRQVLADLIDGMDGFQVVLQAENGLEYQEAVGRGVHVAVAVVDLNMPIMDGYETIAWIKENSPGTRSLAITFELNEQAMVRAIRAGASGFVVKYVGKGVFRQALEQVASVGRYVDEDQLRLSREYVDTGSVRLVDREQVIARLSEREWMFIRLVCADDEPTYEELAVQMEVTLRTVHGYRESVFNKFGIKSKVGLVLFAFKWGLL